CSMRNRHARARNHPFRLPECTQDKLASRFRRSSPFPCAHHWHQARSRSVYLESRDTLFSAAVSATLLIATPSQSRTLSPHRTLVSKSKGTFLSVPETRTVPICMPFSVNNSVTSP